MQQQEGTTDTAVVARPPVAFDLFSKSGTLVVLGIFFVSGLYFLGDTYFVEPYQPLTGLPLFGYVLAAAAGGISAFLLARAAPMIERAALTLMTAAALAAAAYPLMLRINAVTAASGPQLVDYRAAGSGQYQAQDPALPPIQLNPRYTKLMGEMPEGAVQKFPVLLGGLGFYQIDLSALHDQQIALLEAQEKMQIEKLKP